MIDLDSFAPGGIYGPKIEPPMYTEEQVEEARQKRASRLRQEGMTEAAIRSLLWGDVVEVLS